MSWPSNLFVATGVFMTLFWLHPAIDEHRDAVVDVNEQTYFDRRLLDSSSVGVWIFLWLSLADAVERLWR